MGGMIGQVLTLKHPEKILSLVLCDTTSRYPAAAAQVWADRIRTVEAQGMEPMVEPTLGRWLTAPFRARRKDVTERVAGMDPQHAAPGVRGLLPRAAEDQRDRSAVHRDAAPRSSWWATRTRGRRSTCIVTSTRRCPRRS